MTCKPTTVQAVVTIPLIDGDKIQAKHARAVLGCSRHAISNLYKRGYLTPVKRGRLTFVLWSEVQSLHRSSPSKRFKRIEGAPA